MYFIHIRSSAMKVRFVNMYLFYVWPLLIIYFVYALAFYLFTYITCDFFMYLIHVSLNSYTYFSIAITGGVCVGIL